MSSSDRTVSSKPNSFISARSLALLIFMRSGLTFSVLTASASSANSASKSTTSSSSVDLAEALGLRPRLASAEPLASALAGALTTFSTLGPLARALTSSALLAGAAALAAGLTAGWVAGAFFAGVWPDALVAGATGFLDF